MTRETILLGGAAGSGKTHSILTIAKGLPAKRFIAIECDRPNILGMLEHQFSDVKNVEVMSAYSWPDFRQAESRIREYIASKKLGAGDWVAIDGIDLLIQYAKYEFFSQVYSPDGSKRSTWEAMIDKRRGDKPGKSGSPILEPSDWDAIYSEYENAVGYLGLICPCNIIATCGVEPLRLKSQYESDEVKDFYTSMGVYAKFEGYKRNPRLFNTLVLLTADPNGYWYTLWRDTYSSRIQDYEHVRNLRMKNTDFFLSFLAAKAGME